MNRDHATSRVWSLVFMGLLFGNQATAAEPTMETRYSEPDKILVSRDGKIVSSVPCERIPFKYPEGKSCPSTYNPPRFQMMMARTRDGHLWVADHGELFESPDEGRTWNYVAQIQQPSTGVIAFTILRDDTMIAATHHVQAHYDEDVFIVRSTDRGRTWQPLATIPRFPFEYVGVDTVCMTELSNGTILLPMARSNRSWTAWTHEMWHSPDGGATWGSTPFFSGNESDVLELKSGKLLATIRRGRYKRYPNDPPGMAMISQTNSDHAVEGLGPDAAPKAYKLLSDEEQKRHPGHAYKTILIADSDNGGLNWHGLRPVVDKNDVPVLTHDEVHGQLGQLPDGHVVLVHNHRPVVGDPAGFHETMMRVSHDEGRTWDRDGYHLATGHSWPSCLVLADGTIVVHAGPTVVRFALPAATAP